MVRLPERAYAARTERQQGPPMAKDLQTAGRLAWIRQFIRCPSTATHQPSGSRAMTRSPWSRVVMCAGTSSSLSSTTVRRQQTASQDVQWTLAAACLDDGFRPRLHAGRALPAPLRADAWRRRCRAGVMPVFRGCNVRSWRLPLSGRPDAPERMTQERERSGQLPGRLRGTRGAGIACPAMLTPCGKAGFTHRAVSGMRRIDRARDRCGAMANAVLRQRHPGPVSCAKARAPGAARQGAQCGASRGRVMSVRRQRSPWRDSTKTTLPPSSSGRVAVKRDSDS